MMSSYLKLITVTLSLSISADTFAATVQSLTLPLTFEYESNPRLSVSNKQSISRVILIPDYSIMLNQGPDQWFAKASLRMERSSDQAISQDRDDPSLNLGWKHDYETGQFGVTALLNDQSTRVSEFTDSGLVSGDNTKKSRSMSVNWLNRLSDRTSLTLAGVATNVTFDGLNTTGLVNYRNESINTKLSYILSEKTEIFTQLSFSQYKPEDVNSLNSETKSIDFGLIWNANEKLNVTASAGVNETKSESNIQSTSNNKSWQALLSMQYTTLRTNSHLSISRSQSPGSTGSINETNQFAAGWLYNLSEKEEIALDVRWVQNLTQNKSETKSLTAKYTRQISLSWDFSLSATHRNSDNGLFSVSSNSVMASIIYNLSDF